MNKLKKKEKEKEGRREETYGGKELTIIPLVLNLCMRDFLYVNKSF
jgi:hypothetical protein